MAKKRSIRAAKATRPHRPGRIKKAPSGKAAGAVLQPRLIEEPAEESLPAEEENPAIEQLIETGRERGYVTIDDILALFPDAERDIDQLEEAYAALLAAGVTYLDDVT